MRDGVQGRLVAALDGIEVLSSFSRRCESCLERRVTLKDQAGRKIEQQVQLWDTEGLPFTIDNPEPVRVVRAEEVTERNRTAKEN
jgi:hypothetical protein